MKIKTAFAILLLHLFVGCATVSRQPNSKYHEAHYEVNHETNHKTIYEVKMDQAGGRFLVQAKINDQPALLALDTAAEGNVVLFSPAAERIGLQSPATPTPDDTSGKTLAHKTPPQDVFLFNTNCQVPLYLVHLPFPTDTDGTVGWELLKDKITQIDIAARSVRLLDKIPEEAHRWATLRLSPNAGVLSLEIPGPRGNEAVLIDTGNARGVSLSPERWRAWTEANPDRPKTLQVGYIGGSGVVAGEEAWAHQLSFDPLNLSNVPVREASLTEQRATTNFAASLGLVALERLDLIVDGKAGVAYVRPRGGPFRPYSYNRAGVVFIPTDLRDGIHGESKAMVLEGSPAYQAGIRDGDMPEKLGNQSRTNWSKTPTFLASELPAGSKMDLTLKRGEETFNAEVILQDLFPPAASGAK